ncbi:MAG TPA: class I SAM-dependent methyltransferase [Nitrososphaerales archaeon]|nr:class I SAM-dependent methyltransferase [Nitrososphaerales archaeon]
MTDSHDLEGGDVSLTSETANESTESFGLKEDWHSIEKTLEELIPVYDKTNRYISLGSDLKLRRRGLESLRSFLDSDSFATIDLGCGTGKMTQMLHSNFNGPAVLVDALLPMLRVAKERNGTAEGLVSVYENLPFRRSTFDAAMAGFALRDARDLSRALLEIQDMLKPGGFFLIVDLCKPNSHMKRGLIGMYWRIFAPLLALFACGLRGLKFAALSTTYRRLPLNSEFSGLVERSGFEIKKVEYSMLEGACIMLLKKSNT